MPDDPPSASTPVAFESGFSASDLCAFALAALAPPQAKVMPRPLDGTASDQDGSVALSLVGTIWLRNTAACRTLPNAMTKVEALEREVEKLRPEELAAFRDWFVEYDWQAWDRQIERDAAEGRLEKFAAEALSEFERGETREI